MMNWISNVENLNSTLQSLSVRDNAGQEIKPDSAFALWRDHTLKVRKARKTVYLIGNGASASMASHIAADLAKNAHVRTQVFTDLSLITAIGNDLGYEEVFAEPVRLRMIQGDMLVPISSSGRSPNILRAAEEALGLGGFVVTLSAMRHANTLRSLGMLNFYAPAEAYGMAETCHTAILHYWVDQMVEATVQLRSGPFVLEERYAQGSVLQTLRSPRA